MKAYFFYILSKYVPRDIQYTVSLGNKEAFFSDKNLSNSDEEYLLFYAFTNNKEYKKIFIKERSKKFFCKKIEFEDEKEFKSFQMKYSGFELAYYEYETYSKHAKILSTDNEYMHCTCGWMHVLEPIEKIFSHLTENVINSYKDKYISALKKLGLNGLMVVVNEEVYNQMQGASETLGIEFDDDCILTIPEQEYIDDTGKAVIISLSLRGKTLNIFTHSFKALFK